MRVIVPAPNLKCNWFFARGRISLLPNIVCAHRLFFLCFNKKLSVWRNGMKCSKEIKNKAKDLEQMCAAALDRFA